MYGLPPRKINNTAYLGKLYLFVLTLFPLLAKKRIFMNKLREQVFLDVSSRYPNSDALIHAYLKQLEVGSVNSSEVESLYREYLRDTYESSLGALIKELIEDS